MTTRWLFIVWLSSAGAVACSEDFGAPIADPGPAPFPTGTTTFDVVIGADGSVGGGVTYYPTLRAELAGCASCHGADGPIAPPLHTYVAARNAFEVALHALGTGHDGNFSRVTAPCDAAADGSGRPSPQTLVDTLIAWRAAGFPAGQPGNTTPTPDPFAGTTPDLTFALAPASATEPRCYRLEALTDDRYIRGIDVEADGVAWVALYAVPAVFASDIHALEDADVGVGWECGADLGLVPMPLVTAWSLGDGPRDLGAAPLATVAGSLLIARVAILTREDLTPPSLAFDLYLTAPSPTASAFVPLATRSASARFPWTTTTESAPALVAAYSEPTVASLALLFPQFRTCLHARATAGTWPALTDVSAELAAPNSTIQLSVACVEPGPCAAQLELAGALAPTPCGSDAAACAAACDDLACRYACMSADGGRCPLCFLTGQLACRAPSCPDETQTASDRLEGCAATADPDGCIASDVTAALELCPRSLATTPLCDPALAACFPPVAR